MEKHYIPRRGISPKQFYEAFFETYKHVHHNVEKRTHGIPNITEFVARDFKKEHGIYLLRHPSIYTSIETEVRGSTNIDEFSNGNQFEMRPYILTKKYSGTEVVKEGSVILFGENKRKITPVSYTHLTLPTRFSV